jgi:hypothetical protein
MMVNQMSFERAYMNCMSCWETHEHYKLKANDPNYSAAHGWFAMKTCQQQAQNAAMEALEQVIAQEPLKTFRRMRAEWALRTCPLCDKSLPAIASMVDTRTW